MDSRYNDDYGIDPEVLDHLIVRVVEFQTWVLAESFRVIDEFISGENFSYSFEQPGAGCFGAGAKREQKEASRFREKLRDAGLEP